MPGMRTFPKSGSSSVAMLARAMTCGSRKNCSISLIGPANMVPRSRTRRLVSGPVRGFMSPSGRQIRQAALLVFPAAAAGAGIVAVCLGHSRGVLGIQRTHVVLYRLTRAPVPRQVLQVRAAVGVKPLQAGTQIVQTVLALRRPDQTVLRTSAVAQSQDIALLAIAWHALAFIASEFEQRRTFQQFGQRRLAYIPEAILRVDEVVAGIDIAVMLEHDDIAADLRGHAQRVLHAQERPGRLVEVLNIDPADIAPHPLVEDGAEESPVGLGRDGLRADLALPLAGHQRQELQELDADVPEETIHRCGLPHVLIVNHAEHIAMDPMALKHAKRLQHALVRRSLRSEE